MTKRTLVTLVGGPMDGYDEIEARDELLKLFPGPHHRRECGCEDTPLEYVRETATTFRFSRIVERLPSRAANPNGLHKRYDIAKADGSPVDENALYFVLRLDNGGSDPVHIDACRQAAITYAKAVAGTHLDRLGADLLDQVAVMEED